MRIMWQQIHELLRDVPLEQRVPIRPLEAVPGVQEYSVGFLRQQDLDLVVEPWEPAQTGVVVEPTCRHAD